MSRTIVSLVGKNKTFVMLDNAAGDIVMEDLSEVDLAGLAAAATLVQRGDALRQILGSDAAVNQELDTLLNNGPGSDPAPLYFHMRASAADAVVWEQLRAKGIFVALDRRWPIGRIARQPRRLESRVFLPPLRVVAVLAAAGRPGINQLEALTAACAGAALPVELHVISGDVDLQQPAEAAGATFDLIGTSAPALMRQIADAKPHVVHVLCHGGGVAAGLRRLAFAHANDVDAAELDPAVLGSVLVSVTDLAQALLPCNPWLVVLGACESAGGENAGEALALAHELASGGIPAVIGMRRLVDIAATNAFCREFYPEAFAVVRKVLTPAAGPLQDPTRELDWAQALTGPRLAMSDPNPEAGDAWTDPVLYAQHGALRIFVPPGRASPDPHAETVGKIDQFKGGLASLLAADASPAAIAEVLQRIAALEARLGQEQVEQ
jgi:hypothetical protein